MVPVLAERLAGERLGDSRRSPSRCEAAEGERFAVAHQLGRILGGQHGCSGIMRNGFLPPPAPSCSLPALEHHHVICPLVGLGIGGLVHAHIAAHFPQ